jgi:hypothetical protein
LSLLQQRFVVLAAGDQWAEGLRSMSEDTFHRDSRNALREDAQLVNGHFLAAEAKKDVAESDSVWNKFLE